MLVITRRTREGFFVGPEVLIKILEVNGNHVRIGIDAPKNVIVDRCEIRKRRLADSDETEVTSNVDDGLSAA